MSQLSALFLLPRPLNGLITALSVGIGALTAAQAPAWSALLLAALSAALINGAGNAFNDLMDIDIDRINRPLRPLPAGCLSPSAARRQSLLLAPSRRRARVLAQPLAWADRPSRCCLARLL